MTDLATSVGSDAVVGDDDAWSLPAARRRRPRVGVVLAASWLLFVTLLAIFYASLPSAPYNQIIGQPRQSPCWCWPELLGTDRIGRSMTSRIALGARYSLFVSLTAVAIGMVVGGSVGVLAGYWRGWLDRSVGFVVNAGLAFPPLVLLLAVAAVLEPSPISLTVVLAALFVFPFVRLARAATLSLVSREFVLAARVSGTRHRRIILREITPNVILPLLSYAFVIVGAVMIAEGSLSYLGFGIPPPAPSWGGLIAEGREYLDSDAHLVFVPSIALLVTVMSFNVVGDAVRQRLVGGSRD